MGGGYTDQEYQDRAAAGGDTGMITKLKTDITMGDMENSGKWIDLMRKNTADAGGDKAKELEGLM